MDELSTHGGSLRVYARPTEAAGEPTARVKAVLAAEEAAGLHTVAGHLGFAREVLQIKSDLLDFLLTAAAEGTTVAGYGAPGKGNTLLNHCGIRSDLVAYTVDRSPWKQGKFLPGYAHPDPRAGAAGRDPARLHPGAALEPPGGDQPAARVRPGMGRRLVFPIPELQII